MNFIIILPELILFTGALIILMLDVFLGKIIKNSSHFSFLGSLIFSIVSLYAAWESYGSYQISFNNMVSINPFISFSKIITLLLLILVLFISDQFIKSEKRISSEFVALIMIAVTGSMLLISANDLLSFYMALELQSLPLYILASIKRDSAKSSEAGMKYFLLGAVASGILLFGISMIYGFSGTTNISQVLFIIKNNGQSVAILFGFILIMIAMLFKVSAAPFHMWTPDVYQGSPTIITTFFASIIKFMSVLVLIRIYITTINIWPNVNQILIFVAILSLLVGSLGAIKQNDIKRMFAYSGIGHIGFVLAGLATGNFESIKATILYMVIYGTMSLASFAFLISLKNNNKTQISTDQRNDETYQLSSISSLSKKNPLIAAFITIIMLSMAGIPPMAGFFAKFYVLIAIVKNGLYYLAIIAVLTSVISAFYYLRIIKIIYFDNKENNNIEVSFGNASYILIAMALMNLFLFIFLTPLLSLINNSLN